MELRDYQRECLEAIARKGDGRWLCQLATGLGKTVIFANLPFRGRELIISHRMELVRQPLKYYSCPTSVEMGGEIAADTPVVSASIQTLSRRKEKFPRDAFDTIIVDECHHAASESYRSVLGYFQPRRILGFTATPNRGDGRGLSDTFDEIIFQRDLKWGIEHKWLSPITCKRIHVEWDLRQVATRMGDFAQDQLARAVNTDKVNGAVAEAVRKLATPPTLVFAVDVEHARSLADAIGPDAVAMDATMDRDERIYTLRRFAAGEIKVLVNVMLFTEGTDIPNINTVIIARPTRSAGLYTQMVGRGTRLHPGKDRLTLIDCVGASRLPLCTAPTLIGLDTESVSSEHELDVDGDLLAEIPDKIVTYSDVPVSWIRNVELVNLWAKAQQYNLHNVNYFKNVDGSLRLEYKTGSLFISAPDLRGEVRCLWPGRNMAGPAQDIYDNVWRILMKEELAQRHLWDYSVAKRWAAYPPTPKQVTLIKKLARKRKCDVGPVISSINKMQASFMITRLLQ